MKIFVFLSFIFISFIFLIPPSTASIPTRIYLNKPKLMIVLVIDQFRSDYLTRYAQDFLPSENKSHLGGFRYLMEKGAYFPFAQYEVLQNMTCPGHAMISTGSVPRFIGFSTNAWYDSKKEKEVYCVEDEKDSLSPRNLLASTFADELKTVYPNSKVISVALKDRASILLGGHRTNLALWFNFHNLNWETSTYYATSLPIWAKQENEKNLPHKYDKAQMSGPKGIELTIDMALKAL